MKRSTRLVRYEVHALRRMEQRGISREAVNQVLRRPQKVGPARRPGAKRFEGRISATKWLIVVVEDTEEFRRVITAHWR